MSVLEQVDLFLRELCTPNPRPWAWEELDAMLRGEFGDQAVPQLALRLGAVLQSLPVDKRNGAFRLLCPYLMGSAWRSPLLHLLAGSSALSAKTLALLLVIPADYRDLATTAALEPLFQKGRAPTNAQARALGRAFEAGLEGNDLIKLLEVFLAGCRPTRCRRRLEALIRVVGPLEPLTRRLEELNKLVKIRCPRCKIQLPRPAMELHLLESHGLILEGKKVRSAWRAIDSWIGHYAKTEEKKWLRRASHLARSLQKPMASERYRQILWVHGEAKKTRLEPLLNEAIRQNASLCPYCFGLVPVRGHQPLELPTHGSRLISRHGYRVGLEERGFLSRLIVETPSGVLWNGREPGRWLTHRGVVILLCMPLVVTAIILAALNMRLASMAFLAGGALAYGMSLAVTWFGAAADTRVIDYAWTILCPALLKKPLTPENSEFMASLCLASVNCGDISLRRLWLSALRDDWERIQTTSEGTGTYLACVERLILSDAATAGNDFVLMTARQLARSLTGEMPFEFAQQMLADWRMPEWTEVNRARLRILLLDLSFEAGWEIEGLEALAEQAPALGELLDLRRHDQTCEMRWLWSLRAQRPWDRIAPARTCYELALEGPDQAQLFKKCPDLLFREDREDGITVCSSGVIWRRWHLTQLPRRIHITEVVRNNRRSYSLAIEGDHVALAYDPTPLVHRLDHWLTFLQESFQTHAKETRTWTPAPLSSVNDLLSVRCPECQRKLVPRRGKLGRQPDVPDA